MLFRFTHLALAFLQVVRYAAATDENQVPPPDYCNLEIADSKYWGDSSGPLWCASRVKDGVFVNAIKTWSDPLRMDGDNLLSNVIFADGPGLIKGMEITYTDGKTTMIGDQTGKWYQEIKWEPEDVSVEWMSGYDVVLGDNDSGPDDNKNLNILRIFLSDGQFLCAGTHPTKDTNRCNKDKPEDARESIGGTLLGLSGNYGANYVESVTAYMLSSNAKNSEIHDVVLSPSVDEMNKMASDSRGLTKQTLMVGHCVNDLDNGNITFTLADEKGFITTKTTTTEVDNTWHTGTSLSFSYEWGAPISHATVSGSFEFFWEKSVKETTTNTDTETKTVKYSAAIPVAVGKAVRASAYTIEGKMDVTWKGQITLTMEDGNKFTFPTGGTLKDTFYSNSYWLIDDEDPEEARAAVLAGDGKEYQQNGEEKTSTAPSKYLARSFQA